MTANPWGQGHIPWRDWAVLADAFGFASPVEMKAYADDQQRKADKAAVQKYKTG